MKLDGEETKVYQKLIDFIRNVHNKKAVHDTIDELCKRGIAKGCFQDYGLLIAILDLLTALEEAIQ